MRIQKYQQYNAQVTMTLTTPDELQNPTILHHNRLKPRATMVPAQRAGIYYQNKEASDRILSLNGNYQFALFSDYAPDGFEDPAYSTDDWDVLDVPSMWQCRGYSTPRYPNTEYPFPPNPPYIMRVNPVGCYKRTFNCRIQPGTRTILHFAGVDSAFYAYLNGQFVGMSKGSRLPAEFDVTGLIRDGENDLSVKVYTYCDGSYLENQDMLLMSGIFRDVFLMFSPETAVYDWSIITDDRSLRLKAELFEGAGPASARITFDGKSTVVPFEQGVASFDVTPPNVKTWNAEEPNLYDLTMEVLNPAGEVLEVHSKRVGFCKSEIQGTSFLVNGQRILIRGINRHENNAENGRAMTVQQIRADLELLKAYHINGIRCSHYPNNPAFYEMASELGLYVMDESDLETHGAYTIGDIGLLSKTPSWGNAYVDRMQRMVERDKNETCIVMWSVGNETGSGCNIDRCVDYILGREDQKPYQFPGSARIPNPIDWGGYFNLENMRELNERSLKDQKPAALLEYAHAMGNSPGNLENLWDYVLDHPNYFGGFVWEFRSHGFKRHNADGTTDYLYGGDFKEGFSWSNFVLDGYCTSDGTPKPTFDELRNIYAPVTARYEDGILKVRNVQNFLTTERFRYEIEVSCDGQLFPRQVLTVPPVAPNETTEIPVSPAYSGHDCFLNLYITEADGTPVYQKQYALPATEEQKLYTPPANTLEYDSTRETAHVYNRQVEAKFRDGLLCYYRKGNQVYVDAPMEITVYRAETDNDGVFNLFPRWISTWEADGLPRMNFYCFGTTVESDEQGVMVRAKGTMTADHAYTGFEIELTYTVHADGLLQVGMHVQPYGNFYGEGPTPARLPRFGVAFRMPKSFDQVKWFGRGPEQNYADALSIAPVGIYEKPLSRMNFAFDVPQETGNREDVRFVQVHNSCQALTVYGNSRFAFSYHPWTLRNLRAARHPGELCEADHNYLYIDYKMRALGSHSCGPEPESYLDFEPHAFEFHFALNGENVAERPEYFGQSLGDKTRALSGAFVREPIESDINLVECRTND